MVAGGEFVFFGGGENLVIEPIAEGEVEGVGDFFLRETKATVFIRRAFAEFGAEEGFGQHEDGHERGLGSDGVAAGGDVLFPEGDEAGGFGGRGITTESELEFAGDGFGNESFIGKCFGGEGFVNGSVATLRCLIEDDLFGVAKEEIGCGFIDEVEGRIILQAAAAVGREGLGKHGRTFGDGLRAGFVDPGPETPEAGRGGDDGAGGIVEEGVVVDVISEFRKEEPAFGEAMGFLGFEEPGLDPFENDLALGVIGLVLILRGHVVEADLFLDHAPRLEVVLAEIHGEIVEGEFTFLFLLAVTVGAVVGEEGGNRSGLVGLCGGEGEEQHDFLHDFRNTTKERP